jgi:medium-chain acyl-[acyl-carrier-protein] hydrolase
LNETEGEIIVHRSSKWTLAFKPNPGARMRLLCIPYAGSGASVYRDWHAQVRDDVEVVGIQLPGRENRFSEPYLHSIDEVVEQLVPVITSLSDKPFVLFGHSMGALISFELTRALQRLRGPVPRHLIASGTRAPHVSRRDEPIHQLDDMAFLERIRRFNGTPKALLQDEELMKVLTPLLRADFGIAETYRHQDRGPVWCPLTVLGGDQDDGVPLEDLQAWRAAGRASYDQHVFAGDHFFIHGHKAAVIGLVNGVFDGLLGPRHPAPAAPAPRFVVEEGIL